MASDKQEEINQLERDMVNAAECMDFCLKNFGNWLSGSVGKEVKDEMKALVKKYVNDKT